MQEYFIYASECLVLLREMYGHCLGFSKQRKVGEGEVKEKLPIAPLPTFTEIKHGGLVNYPLLLIYKMPALQVDNNKNNIHGNNLKHNLTYFVYLQIQWFCFQTDWELRFIWWI